MKKRQLKKIKKLILKDEQDLIYKMTALLFIKLAKKSKKFQNVKLLELYKILLKQKQTHEH